MNNKNSILIVDDEEGILSFLNEACTRMGYITTLAEHGEQALQILRDLTFDLAVLDLNLGGKTDGLKVLEAIRWRWPQMAVIILTGHGSLESAMQAIRYNVDLYLLKPIETDQLREAVEQSLEKKAQREIQIRENGEKDIIALGGIEMDIPKHRVMVLGEKKDLTSHEFTLLMHLMKNSHRVVSPKELAQIVGDFKPDSMYEARQYIKWHIHQLRNKIEPDTSRPRWIQTIREAGYRFTGDET